jgi:hypothetical protein
MIRNTRKGDIVHDSKVSLDIESKRLTCDENYIYICALASVLIMFTLYDSYDLSLQDIKHRRFK